MFKETESQRINVVKKSAKIIAETLGHYIYSTVNDGEIFTNLMEIKDETVRPWLNIKSTQQNNDLKNAFEKYLKNVKVTFEKPDVREPDFMLYDGHDGVLNVYR